MKVLIADDNSRMRLLIRQMLETPGIECIECSNGEEAVEICFCEQPDWVLLDIEMPRMDGFETLHELVKRCPRSRVVMVTAFDTPLMRAKAASQGATAFIPKDDLYKLRSLITISADSTENPPPNPSQP